jgi:cytochrome c-type biogenesis protein CcmE
MSVEWLKYTIGRLKRTLKIANLTIPDWTLGMAGGVLADKPASLTLIVSVIINPYNYSGRSAATIPLQTEQVQIHCNYWYSDQELLRMRTSSSKLANSNRLKFIIAGGLFLIAVILMVISASQATAEFFMTVRELQESDTDRLDKNLRVSGAVYGDSIVYDPETGFLHFTIAHIPGDDDEIKSRGGLSQVLHQAVNDPGNPSLAVVYAGPQPDMLRHEAQAIITGTLNSEGVFIAEELLLKCPTRYEEALPGQVER